MKLIDRNPMRESGGANDRLVRNSEVERVYLRLPPCPLVIGSEHSTGLPSLNERYWSQFPAFSLFCCPSRFGLFSVAEAIRHLPLKKEFKMSELTRNPPIRNARRAESCVRGTRSARKTKKNQLIALLRTKRGISVNAISSKLGWQNHSTRAALTRLRQAGFELDTLKTAKTKLTRYRIIADKPSNCRSETGCVTDA